MKIHALYYTYVKNTNKFQISIHFFFLKISTIISKFTFAFRPFSKVLHSLNKSIFHYFSIFIRLVYKTYNFITSSISYCFILFIKELSDICRWWTIEMLSNCWNSIKVWSFRMYEHCKELVSFEISLIIW